jgi:hypothetical protein
MRHFEMHPLFMIWRPEYRIICIFKKKNGTPYRRYQKIVGFSKAELYCLLRDDEELKNYMISNKMLFEELIRRDKAHADGKIHLTTRQQLG